MNFLKICQIFVSGQFVRPSHFRKPQTSVSSFSLEANGLKFCIQTFHIYAQAWQQVLQRPHYKLQKRKTTISQFLDKNLKIWSVTFLVLM